MDTRSCDVFPRHAGEQRWPGSNQEVTLDAYQFCQIMRMGRAAPSSSGVQLDADAVHEQRGYNSDH